MVSFDRSQLSFYWHGIVGMSFSSILLSRQPILPTTHAISALICDDPIGIPFSAGQTIVPDSVDWAMIEIDVLTQYQCVTDGRTDRCTDGRTEFLYQYCALHFALC